MDCPNCGKAVGGVAMLIGVVKLTTFRCRCGRVWRLKALVASFSVALFSAEVERLEGKYPGFKPPHVKIALGYIQAKLDDHSYSSMDAERARKKKWDDLWEREFLKQALGEDY